MKSTKLEIENRVTEIIGLIRDGKTYTQILNYACETWHISNVTMNSYMNRVRDYFASQSVGERKQLIGEARERLLTLYQKCMELKHTNVALGCLKELDKINGLDIEKHEITGKDGNELVLKVIDGRNGDTPSLSTGIE